MSRPAPVAHSSGMTHEQFTALDLFAGTGWGVACQRLDIEECGVEIMPEAVATRFAAGMTTVYHDVWDGLSGVAPVPAHDILIASPPCQTFSMAGKGAGRAALDDVLGLIASGAWREGSDGLRQAAQALGLDDRTALVLSPLAYAHRYLPTFIVLEQVPTVLPVWRAIGAELEKLGYSVAVDLLHAEQYGVPQTRKRAILIARRDGEPATLPAPTHSRYYPRDPARLDSGVAPWVSMADALGWVSALREKNEVDRSNWARHRPSTTVVGSFSPDIIAAPGSSGVRATDVSRHRQDRPGSVRVTIEEAATLQSYPAGFPWQGTKTKQFLQVGNAVPPLLAEAILRTLL